MNDSLQIAHPNVFIDQMVTYAELQSDMSKIPSLKMSAIARKEIENMNDSLHKRKVDLIMQAAKNVLVDPLIDFDTPEGAKEALVNEIARIKKQEEADDAEMKMLDRIDEVIPPSTPIERFMDELFDFYDIHEDTRSDFAIFMRLFNEACEKYGYPKSEDGGYHLEGEPVLIVAKYINDHWVDIPKDDDEDPKPGNLNIEFER